MIVLKCAHCHSRIIRYVKTGKGRVLRCFKERIVKYYISADSGDLICPCQRVMGTDEGQWYKMKQKNFYFTGSINKK